MSATPAPSTVGVPPAAAQSFEVQAITSEGLEVQRQYLALIATLRAPVESLNSAAVAEIEDFFAKVARLWARIEQFQSRRGQHVALVVEAYDIAGQGVLRRKAPRGDVLVSQIISKMDRNKGTVTVR